MPTPSHSPWVEGSSPMTERRLGKLETRPPRAWHPIADRRQGLGFWFGGVIEGSTPVAGAAAGAFGFVRLDGWFDGAVSVEPVVVAGLFPAFLSLSLQAAKLSARRPHMDRSVSDFMSRPGCALIFRNITGDAHVPSGASPAPSRARPDPGISVRRCHRKPRRKRRC